jgi:hypothetical protein
MLQEDIQPVSQDLPSSSFDTLVVAQGPLPPDFEWHTKGIGSKLLH